MNDVTKSQQKSKNNINLQTKLTELCMFGLIILNKIEKVTLTSMSKWGGGGGGGGGGEALVAGGRTRTRNNSPVTLYFCNSKLISDIK